MSKHRRKTGRGEAPGATPSAGEGAAADRRPWVRRHLVLLVFVVLVAAVDLYSKHWAFATHEPFRAYPLLGDLLAVRVVENQGIPWGLLAGRRWVLVGLGLAAVVVITWLFLGKFRHADPGTHVGLGLILGGAVGNLHDRIRYGHVRDFIELVPELPRPIGKWPVFNVADAAMCVGVLLVFVTLFWAERKGKDAPSG